MLLSELKLEVEKETLDYVRIKEDKDDIGLDSTKGKYRYSREESIQTICEQISRCCKRNSGDWTEFVS